MPSSRRKASVNRPGFLKPHCSAVMFRGAFAHSSRRFAVSTRQWRSRLQKYMPRKKPRMSKLNPGLCHMYPALLTGTDRRVVPASTSSDERRCLLENQYLPGRA